MKSTLSALSALAIAVLAMSFTTAPVAKEKKTQNFIVKKVLPFSADAVWKAVGEDYGSIADMHPRIVQSEYIGGSLKAEEGAERVCNFNDKGTQYLKEKMINYNPENMSFTNTIYRAGRFPVEPELTNAIYSVKPIDGNSCELSFNMTYRTKPAMMGGMVKNKFRGLIQDYFIAIEHHLKTGEKVTRDNFKTIKKDYKA